MLAILLAFDAAFTGKYVSTQDEGVYVCSACEAPLFDSKDKYDAGVGWPCFKEPVEKRAVFYIEDRSLGFLRYEVHCRGCEGGLGHVFNDGPPKKNFRYTVHSSLLLLKSKN